MTQTPITIQTTIAAPLTKVWQYWNAPEHITNWAFASDDWECPAAENDLRVGGKFKTVMAAKDKSTSFDFEGEYTQVQEHTNIAYAMSDGRTVNINFDDTPEEVTVTQTFDPEPENSREMQQAGWQAILDNFKKYVEKN